MTNPVEFVNSRKHLPDIMYDFHDQKELFKTIHNLYQKRVSTDSYLKHISWQDAHVYTIDIFLWFMAQHGYTLQKSRQKIQFYDIVSTVNEFTEKECKEIAKVTNTLFNTKIHKRKKKCEC